MAVQPCEERVEAGGGRTIAKPCGVTGVCTLFDILAWRDTATAWIEGAASVARTPYAVGRVTSLREAFANVWGLPGPMVAAYGRIAVSASCLMAQLVAEQVKPSPVAPPVAPPAPPPTPDPGSTWPSLPGLPGFPSLPQFPQLDPNLLLIAALLFAGGWLTGEIFEEIY